MKKKNCGKLKICPLTCTSLHQCTICNYRPNFDFNFLIRVTLPSLVNCYGCSYLTIQSGVKFTGGTVFQSFAKLKNQILVLCIPLEILIIQNDKRLILVIEMCNLETIIDCMYCYLLHLTTIKSWFLLAMFPKL